MEYKDKYLKYKEKYKILKNAITGGYFLELLYLDNIHNQIRPIILNDNFDINTCMNSAMNLNISKDKYKRLLEYIIIIYKKNKENRVNIKQELKIINNNIIININLNRKYKDYYDIIIDVLNNCLINYYPSYIVNPIYYPKTIKYIVPHYIDEY